METDNVYLCHKCGKTFYKLSTLESHSRWKHAEKTNEFMCDQCGRTFQKKYNLIKHLESAVHEISESVNCALCNFKSLNRKLMCEHYQSFHGVLLKETNVYFKTPEEFFSWKSLFESRTKSRFVKMSSSRMRKNGFIRSTYFCHRDGNFIPKGRNLRHMKVKGSNKINAHCPAKIEVEIGDKITIVSYIDTHLGHDQDISRMSLDPADKVLIARKLALKVPFEQILDEVNSFKRDGEVKRVNLLTRKDLWNIVDTYKINPKNVVFSKNRLSRKKKMEHLKREPRKNQICLKVVNQETDSVEDEDAYGIDEEEEYTGRQVISIKQDSDENVVFCPVVDENNVYVEEYSVVANENDDGGGTCLIINANGELQSISGHKIIYTEDGNIEICEDVDGSEMIVDEPSEIFQVDNSCVESSIVNNEETVDSSSKVVLIDEPRTSNSEEFKVETSQCESSCKDNVASVIENVVLNESNSNDGIKFKCEDEDLVNTEIVFIKTENSEDFTHQSILSTEEDITEYEVTISNHEGEDHSEYVIISTENEEMVECDTILTENSTVSDLGASVPLETVVFNTAEDGPSCSEISEEIGNMDGCEEYIVSNDGEKPKWNVKRNKALHKLLDVHNLINNEQQLQVFSNNISSLENVLKALSKDSQDSD